MLDCYAFETDKPTIPIQTIITQDFQSWLQKQSDTVKNWVNVTSFSARPGEICYLGDQEGDVKSILLGIRDATDVWSLGSLPTVLKAGIYNIDQQYPADLQDLVAIAWGLGHYYFGRYRSEKIKYEPKLLLSTQCNYHQVESTIQATYLVRDLINTPAEDLGPAELGEIALALAKEFDAKIELTIGEELLKKNYPAIHRVGRASAQAPRLIDLHWGEKNHPSVVLLGKGVCFDTGGLDIKTPLTMRHMKKDMAGAAHVLGLAHMIMKANLPIQLRVLIPAVENSVSASSMRPGDIIRMRNGLFVEITNTDAEGRLILADVLTEAVSQQPDLVVDIATLTGAARVALGPEPGAIFTNKDEIAQHLYLCSLKEQDPLWPLPIYKPYRNLLESCIADIANADTESVGGGAIMAALFLNEFVPDTINWLHLDIMAYNLKYKPSRPIGGEAMGIRAIYRYLVEKYCSQSQRL